MKKFIAVILSLLLVCSVFASCGKTESNTPNKPADTSSTVDEAGAVPFVIDQAEYTLYQNIFFNDYGKDYDGKSVEKKGTFTTLYDEYNGVVRYYVWGYMDNTKCCDYQWEIVPTDTKNLPANGSLVEVKGVFASDEKALDGYWVKDAEVSVTKEYEGAAVDYDLTTMNGTLLRVQIQNMQQFPEKFEGKKVRAYGRVESPSTFQHPYYDNTFSQHFATSDKIPAIGTEVIVEGTYTDGVITDATVNETTQF